MLEEGDVAGYVVFRGGSGVDVDLEMSACPALGGEFCG